MIASLNAGMEQDFIDTIGRLNKMILRCRQARTFAMLGDKDGLETVLADMRALRSEIDDTLAACEDTLDTFTEKETA